MRSAGDLQVSLVGLAAGWSGANYDGLKLKTFPLTPRLLFGPHWELTDLEAEDATGNPGVGRDPFGAGKGLRWNPITRPVSAEFRLCTNETAWKLHATFLRTAYSQFASNETRTIPALALPAPGTARILNLSNTWQGVTVRFCAIGGPGRITYSNGIPLSIGPFTGGRGGGGGGRTTDGVTWSENTMSSDKPQLMLHISGLNEEWQFHPVARISGSIYPCHPAAGKGYNIIPLDVPEGSDVVDLTFVIQKPRLLDFSVRPQAPTGQ